MKNLNELIRPNILALSPYSCARNEFTGEASVFLDANENPENGPYNRYPDPLQLELKAKIAKVKGVRPTQIMLGNGSDEPIDLVVRIFCEPKEDNIVAIEPTYGMYKVCADVNNVEYRPVLLGNDFSLDSKRLLDATDSHTKVIFLCSPNNPTGNLLNRDEVLKVVNGFDGIVVIDEAYFDFTDGRSWLADLDQHKNVIVLQTFSKAWGLASVRCGMAFAAEEIIAFFNNVKYPYNINLLTQRFVSEQIDLIDRKNQWVKQILGERTKMIDALGSLPFVERVYHTDANFVLIKVTDAVGIYNRLVQKGIIVRNRHTVRLCQNCLRITIGSAAENQTLMNELKNMKA